MGGILIAPERKADLVLNTAELKAYLKEQGWTMVDLSKRMGISYNMLHLVMKGKRNPGGCFVAGLLHACEDGHFEQFFTVTEKR